MSRSKCDRFNDEELRVLICVAGFGPLSLTELSKMTGITMGNLSHAGERLVSKGFLKHLDGPETKMRGRPREYLSLASPWFTLYICDELEYRLTQYQIELEKLKQRVNSSDYANWIENANALMYETGLRNDKQLRWECVIKSTKVISPPGVEYWLARLRSQKLKVLGFLFDNPYKNYSISEIAGGAGIDDMVSLSETLKKLVKSDYVISVANGKDEAFKLNDKNTDAIELMDTVGLRKINAQHMSAIKRD